MHCSCGLQIGDRWWACSLNFRTRHPLNPSIIFHATVLSLECQCHMPERKTLPVATHCPHTNHEHKIVLCTCRPCFSHRYPGSWVRHVFSHLPSRDLKNTTAHTRVKPAQDEPVLHQCMSIWSRMTWAHVQHAPPSDTCISFVLPAVCQGRRHVHIFIQAGGDC